MKIHIAVCEDRHIDPVVKAFKSKRKARAYARDFMKNQMAHPEGITEQIAGDVLYLNYDYERDQAFVMSCEVED